MQLSAAIVAALKDADVAKRLTDFGFILAPGGPDELKALIERDIAKWDPLITAAGVKK
jgi:tripartite-type tricarboxylate transporter receptor subunit TctC